MNSQPRNSGHWDELGYLPPECRPGRAAAGSRAAPAWSPPAPQPRICLASPSSPSPEPRPPCTGAGGTLRHALPAQLCSPTPRPPDSHGTAAESSPLPPRPRGARSQLGPLIATPALRAPRGASAPGIAAVPALSGGRTGDARGSSPPSSPALLPEPARGAPYLQIGGGEEAPLGTRSPG